MDIEEKPQANHLVNSAETITVYNQATHKMEVLDLHTGEVLMEDGIPSESLQFMPTTKTFEAICALIREGSSLEKVAEMRGFPSIHVMYGWKRKFKEFKKLILEAREDRADFFMEKAEHEVDAALTAEDARIAKVKFDAYTNLAEKYNRREYAKPERTEAGNNGPVQIIVHTGIKRNDPVDYVEVSYEDEESKNIGPPQPDPVGRNSFGAAAGSGESSQKETQGKEDQEVERQKTGMGEDSQQEGEF